MQSRTFRVAAALLGVALCAAPAAAQDQSTEFPSWNIPGWTFTPGVVLGAHYDTNVTLTAPGFGQDIPSDKLILELLQHTPTMLLLDEFQTW